MGVLEVLLGDREDLGGGKGPPSFSKRPCGGRPRFEKAVTGVAEALSHRKRKVKEYENLS